MPDILRDLIQKVAEISLVMDHESIPTDVGLLKAGVIDSFGFVELVVFVEQHFGLSLDDDELNDSNFGSLMALADFIQRKLEESPK